MMMIMLTLAANIDMSFAIIVCVCALFLMCCGAII